MDASSLLQVLEATLQPHERQAAERKLDEFSKVPEFTPCLLQIVLDGQANLAVRQAGAIYLKNMIMKYWKVREVTEGAEPMYFLPDEVKEVVRNNIVESIIQTPLLVGRQLCISVEHMIKLDYPEKWTGIVEKIHTYLSSDNQTYWLGALLSLYQLARKYKFKKEKEERFPYIQPMRTYLPLLLQRMEMLLPLDTEDAARLQHWILKIFHSTIQYSLPLELINDVTLPGWIAAIQTVVSKPEPLICQSVDPDDKPRTEWWKCKKWAMRILWRLFEHYGNPGTVIDPTYAEFSKYFVKTFAVGIVQCLLQQLGMKQQGHYVAPRVLQLIFNYLEQVVHHTPSWTIIKPHFVTIYQDIMFPLMCYDDDDDLLWKEDPQEYIRGKYDVFEDLISPVTAAVTVIHQAAKHRKGTMDLMVKHCLSILHTADNPRMKDGALHVIGILAELLMKRKNYRNLVEKMIMDYVFPHYHSEFGFLRARACWMLHHFCDVKLNDTTNAQKVTECVLQLLLHDKDLPVKVDAGVALQFLVKYQEISLAMVKPLIKQIIEELLKMIKESENDDVTSVLEYLIKVYGADIGDVAIDLCTQLASVFGSVCDSATSGEDDGYRALTAIGLLSAIQTLVKAAVENQPLLDSMEAALIPLIVMVFKNGIMDFYEEMLALVEFLTANKVSPAMWQLFDVLYEVFRTEGGYDCFGEMCPIFYNYVTTDTSAFLSNSKHVEVIIGICKQMLTTDPGDTDVCYACKLLEVMILHCRQSIVDYYPIILHLVLERLTKIQHSIEVRLLCEVVVLSALYCNAMVTMAILEQVHFPGSQESITEQFFTKLLEDTEKFDGIHDRKIAVLALCSIVTCQTRPPCIHKLADHLLLASGRLLKYLVKAYEEAADVEVESEQDSDEESEEEDEEADEEENLKKMREKAAEALKKLTSNNEEDDGLSYADELMLEIDFETVIDDEDSGVDEYVMFKDSLQALAQHDPMWYTLFTQKLTPEQNTMIQEMLQLAEHKRAYQESKQLEHEGYQFQITQVDNASFKFGSGTVPAAFQK
jgi:hypothetical protein